MIEYVLYFNSLVIVALIILSILNERRLEKKIKQIESERDMYKKQRGKASDILEKYYGKRQESDEIKLKSYNIDPEKVQRVRERIEKEQEKIEKEEP